MDIASGFKKMKPLLECLKPALVFFNSHLGVALVVAKITPVLLTSRI